MTGRFFSFLITFALPALAFAQNGEALYRAHCASCHEASAEARAPSRDALRQLTPERILDALEAQSGAMRVQGLARTSAERRALALFLSGKPFGTEKPLDLTQASCKQPTAFNARFQNAASAGLDADRVPQLKLKWAFAYPGDVIAYGHPTVVGGRVF